MVTTSATYGLAEAKLSRHQIIALDDFVDHSAGLIIEPTYLAAQLKTDSVSRAADPVGHAAGFRREFKFSGDKRRQIVEYLFNAWEDGVESVSTEVMFADLEFKSASRTPWATRCRLAVSRPESCIVQLSWFTITPGIEREARHLGHGALNGHRRQITPCARVEPMAARPAASGHGLSERGLRSEVESCRIDRHGQIAIGGDCILHREAADRGYSRAIPMSAAVVPR